MNRRTDGRAEGRPTARATVGWTLDVLSFRERCMSLPICDHNPGQKQLYTLEYFEIASGTFTPLGPSLDPLSQLLSNRLLDV